MAGGILHQNLVVQGVGLSSGYATVSALPLSNLLDPQPRTRCRLVGESSSGGFYGHIIVDLLAQVAVDCVAWISTTMDSDASGVVVRARLATADTTGVAGDAWDSGLVSASTSQAANGNVVLIRSAGTATGRYLLMEIAAHAGQLIDIGRIVAGSLWRPTYSHAYGIEEGRLILDRRDRNALTGAEFPVASIRNPRTASFILPSLSSAEAKGAHRDLLWNLGASGEGLWVPDLALSQSEINARSIWGSFAVPGEAAATASRSVHAYSRSFRLTERV